MKKLIAIYKFLTLINVKDVYGGKFIMDSYLWLLTLHIILI